LDYEIAVLLKRKGVSKREIVKELAAMDESEKKMQAKFSGVFEVDFEIKPLWFFYFIFTKFFVTWPYLDTIL